MHPTWQTKDRTWCAYCGHEYPRGTPKHHNAALTAHIRECPDHPMKALLDFLKAYDAWVTCPAASDEMTFRHVRLALLEARAKVTKLLPESEEGADG